MSKQQQLEDVMKLQGAGNGFITSEGQEAFIQLMKEVFDVSEQEVIAS
jgi:hypothetical protein